jgi:hypothetical protein
VSRAIAHLLLLANSRYRIQEDAVFKMRQPPARASRDPLADPYDKAAAMPRRRTPTKFRIFRISLARIKSLDYNRAVPLLQRGVSRSSRTSARDAVDAAAPLTNGAFRGRPSRVVLTPRRRRQVGGNSFPLMTVTRKPDRRGEHEGNRKTIARGMPG